MAEATYTYFMWIIRLLLSCAQVNFFTLFKIPAY